MGFLKTPHKTFPPARHGSNEIVPLTLVVEKRLGGLGGAKCGGHGEGEDEAWAFRHCKYIRVWFWSKKATEGDCSSSTRAWMIRRQVYASLAHVRLLPKTKRLMKFTNNEGMKRKGRGAQSKEIESRGICSN